MFVDILLEIFWKRKKCENRCRSKKVSFSSTNHIKCSSFQPHSLHYNTTTSIFTQRQAYTFKLTNQRKTVFYQQDSTNEEIFLDRFCDSGFNSIRLNPARPDPLFEVSKKKYQSDNGHGRRIRVLDAGEGHAQRVFRAVLVWKENRSQRAPRGAPATRARGGHCHKQCCVQF